MAQFDDTVERLMAAGCPALLAIEIINVVGNLAGFLRSPVSVSANYHVPDTGIGVVRCNASGGGFSVFLPLLANTNERTITVMRDPADTTYNPVSVFVNPLDGNTKVAVYSVTGGMNFFNNGASWDINV